MEIKSLKKAIIIRLVIIPSATYIAMKIWQAYIDNLGWWERLKYYAQIEDRRLGDSKVENFLINIFQNPGDYAWFFVMLFLVVGGIDILLDYSAGKLE